MVNGDDVVKRDVLPILHFADSVDSAHNQLVEVSLDQQLWLSRKLDLHHQPNLLDNFFRRLQLSSNVRDLLSTELEDSLEKHVVRLHDRVALSSFSVFTVNQVLDDFDDR